MSSSGFLFVENYPRLPCNAPLEIPRFHHRIGHGEGILDGHKTPFRRPQGRAALFVDAGIIGAVADVQLLHIGGFRDQVVPGDEVLVAKSVLAPTYLVRNTR